MIHVLSIAHRFDIYTAFTLARQHGSAQYGTVWCRNAVYSHCCCNLTWKIAWLQKRMWNIIISALSKDGSNVSFLLLFYWRFFAVRRATILRKRQSAEADQTCTTATAMAAKSDGTPSRVCILPLPH